MTIREAIREIEKVYPERYSVIGVDFTHHSVDLRNKRELKIEWNVYVDNHIKSKTFKSWEAVECFINNLNKTDDVEKAEEMVKQEERPSLEGEPHKVEIG